MPSRVHLIVALLFSISSCFASQLLSDSQQVPNSSSLSGSKMSIAWYTSWHTTALPLSNVSWSKYTDMNYAFALTTPDPSVVSLADPDQLLLPKFVAAAHKHKVRAGLSIGGWTGSRYFSTNVGSTQNRTAFANAVVALVKQYNLDGIEFDWEYPGRQGVGCNVVSSDDTQNFLLFLRELRNRTGENVVLSAATEVKPFIASSGAPSSDVSGFSKVLNYITIMNYDLKSNSSTGAGPNAPIDDSCAPPNSRSGSAVSAVSAWTQAGMPSNQIVLGVPTYGRSYRVASSDAFAQGSDSTLVPFPPFDTVSRPPGDRWDDPGGMDVCGNRQGPGGTYQYWGLMENGFLNQDGTVKQGIVYRFDNCSETPFLYKPSTQVLVSYEDAQSFAAKGDYIKTSGLKGFAMWEAAGDFKNTLIDAILNGTINGASRTKMSSSPFASPSASPLSSSGAKTNLLFGDAILYLSLWLAFSLWSL